MTTRRLLPLLACLCLLPALPTPAEAAPPDAEQSTERWYETLQNGNKIGYSRVVWAPSTWEGRPTLHDTTTFVNRSVRNMMGVRDVFETTHTVDLERDADGTLWWRKDVVEEAGRIRTEELIWTGEGYDHVARLEGEEERESIPLEAPVMTDVESFLGERIRGGTLEVGAAFEVPYLNVRAREAQATELTVLARETLPDEDGKEIGVFKVRERDPRTGSENLQWLDDDGALVRLTTDGGLVIRRVKRAAAESAPVQPAEFRITTPATPVLERVFSAERLLVDVHLQGDPNRALPEFPDSPWSRIVARRGSDESGWVFEAELTAYDDPDATATLPMDTEAFEREMETTVLMPWRHPTIQRVVQGVVGEETDARRVAHRLARFVFSTLRKGSPAVAEASALQILEESCGDCSEHALLYVTLCRAAGIPARRASGYVCIGSQWGAHAWAEIWLGQWVGADPTTGEVGNAARYLFFGYQDDPDSHPGVVTVRSRGRMRFVATRIEEGDDAYDLTDPEGWHVHDAEAGRYVHVLAGIEARDVPRDWIVRMTGHNRAMIRAEDLRVDLRLDADQGHTLDDFGGGDVTFAGVPARRVPMSTGIVYLLHSRRRLVQMQIRSEFLEDRLPELERILAPTFAARPSAPAEDAEEETQTEPDEDGEER
ncbi:MAG: transglutaminase-like domain-containing protein [Planctomycetota bacterium]|jgi:hypothetical protein